MQSYRNKIVSIISNNKVLVNNFFYVSLLQVFLLIAPLITYPYLVKILGMELYGVIITAQILASYASIFINFGSNEVCAKHISVNREDKDKLSEIVSSVLIIRAVIWLSAFFVYLMVVFGIPKYREHALLFILMYGITTNELLFPQYFFQGIEKMKYSTLINILIKLVFILLVFVVVQKPDDYLYVPILYSVGYIIGGVVAIWIVFKKERIIFCLPSISQALFYIKDSSALFFTDLVCTIKDKFNYLLLGSFCGMANVVVYDLGMKIYGLASKPASIVSVVFFPHSAKTRSITQFKKVLWMIVVIDMLIILLVNIFLPFIVDFFIDEQIDLMPLRLFSIAPLFSTVGAYIVQNLCIAYGYNKYVLYSILVTTSVYIVILVIFYFTHFLGNLYAFVLLAVISYFAEFVYRLIAYKSILHKEIKPNK